MEMALDGIAVVTGAGIFTQSSDARNDYADMKVLTGSGIGRDCAFAYAAAGAAGVVFADIDLNGAQKAASESQSFGRHPSYRAIALAVDVSQEEDMNAMIERVVQEFGRIDYAVNSAGVSFQISARPELYICFWLRRSLIEPRLELKRQRRLRRLIWLSSKLFSTST